MDKTKLEHKKNNKMTKKQNYEWLRKPESPQLFWNNITPSPQKYKILLYNVFNPKPSSIGRNWNRYIVFETKFLEGHTQLNIDNLLIYRLHLPKASFKIAWEQYRGLLPRTNDYDCIIILRRKNVKVLEILGREFIKMGIQQ